MSSLDPTSSGRAPVLVLLMTLVLTLVLTVSACSSSASPATTRARPSDPTSTTRGGTGADPNAGADPIRPPSAQVAARVAALPGRLAIGLGNGLSLARPDGSNLSALEADPATVAAQPTWSRDGTHLAWSRTASTAAATTASTVATPATTAATTATTATASTLATPARAAPDLANQLVVLDVASNQRTTSELAGNAAFYLQWSADGKTVAFLRNDTSQAAIELGLLYPGGPPVRVGVASPLFISWAPGPAVLAAHVGQQQVLVLPSPLAPPAIPPLQPASVLQPSGPFTSPAWIDDATLLVASPDGLAKLDLATHQPTVVVPTTGQVNFVLSGDHKRVAFHEQGRQGASVSPAVLTPSTTAPGAGNGANGGGGGATGAGSGGLQVLELATGALTKVTDVGPLAFQWAPDSQHLAWLDPGPSALRPRVHWSFWDGKANTSSVAFALGATVRDHYLPFFEQYAQSMTGWSPDSSAFAFAGHPDGAAGDGVWVQLVDEPGAGPIQVAAGDVVAWSP